MRLNSPHSLPLRAVLAALIAGSIAALTAAEPSRYEIKDLLGFQRLGEAQVSPDGKSVAFSLKKMDPEKNSSVSHIWIISADGGTPRKITDHEKGETRPRWSPDGKTIAFISARSGESQVWTVSPEGGEAKQVTSLSTGADQHIWSPTGHQILFTSDIYPELNGGDEAQKKRAEEVKNRGQAKVIDGLLYRHWRDWRDGKRTHIFVSEITEKSVARDLTPGDFEAPPYSLGGGEDFSVSPDGQELAFTQGPVGPTGSSRDLEAWSTDANLCIVPVAGGPIRNLTADNKGWDGTPVWSPDGKFIAYRSQRRNGYESDKFRLAILERATGRKAYFADDVDRSIDEIFWVPDGKSVYFRVEDEARSSLFQMEFNGLASHGKSRAILHGVQFTDLSMPKDGSFFVGEVQSLVQPAELSRFDLDANNTPPALKRLTHVNDAHLSSIAMPSYESVHFPGASNSKIQAWILKPQGQAQDKPGPFVLCIHGGPQSVWGDAFSYRWNAALLAAKGYTVMMPNPHGSTGFGTAFTEEISRDWPGACYQDLMKGVDWAIAQKIADPARMAAIGGSFGGYMVNWILGHNNRFRALVSHAGVYNLDSMYGATEELWFPEWELGGPPWKNSSMYAKFSPHRSAANFRTPTLVIHGELDFRVPVTEGLQLFTALKRQGVESRLLYFPDEGHWILKPKNSEIWYETVLGWLDGHLRN